MINDPYIITKFLLQYPLAEILSFKNSLTSTAKKVSRNPKPSLHINFCHSKLLKHNWQNSVFSFLVDRTQHVPNTTSILEKVENKTKPTKQWYNLKHIVFITSNCSKDKIQFQPPLAALCGLVRRAPVYSQSSIQNHVP